MPSRGKRNSLPAISTPRFEGGDNPPAGRPRTFASYRRAIFMGHSVWVLFSLSKAGQPGMCRRWCQRKNAPSEDATFRLCRNLPGTAEGRIPCALRLYEEKRVCTQLIRRRRKTLTAFFAWRREIKKRFCRLLGLWPKGGGRTHPCEGRSTPFCGQTSPQACGWLGCRPGDADRRFLWEFRAMRETSPPVTAQPAQYAPNRYIKYAVNGRGTLVQCAEKFSSG